MFDIGGIEIGNDVIRTVVVLVVEGIEVSPGSGRRETSPSEGVVDRQRRAIELARLGGMERIVLGIDNSGDLVRWPADSPQDNFSAVGSLAICRCILAYGRGDRTIKSRRPIPLRHSWGVCGFRTGGDHYFGSWFYLCGCGRPAARRACADAAGGQSVA